MYHDIVTQFRQSPEIRSNPSDVFQKIILDKKLVIEDEIKASLEKLEENFDRQLEKAGMLNDLHEDMKRFSWHVLGKPF